MRRAGKDGCATCCWQLFWVLLGSGAHAREPDMIGPATVVDGDKIEIAGQRIRLYGIDAPELSQTVLPTRTASDIAAATSPPISSKR